MNEEAIDLLSDTQIIECIYIEQMVTPYNPLFWQVRRRNCRVKNDEIHNMSSSPKYVLQSEFLCSSLEKVAANLVLNISESDIKDDLHIGLIQSHYSFKIHREAGTEFVNTFSEAYQLCMYEHIPIMGPEPNYCSQIYTIYDKNINRLFLQLPLLFDKMDNIDINFKSEQIINVWPLSLYSWFLYRGEVFIFNSYFHETKIIQGHNKRTTLKIDLFDIEKFFERDTIYIHGAYLYYNSKMKHIGDLSNKQLRIKYPKAKKLELNGTLYKAVDNDFEYL
jgi:hypothetical protein